LPEWFIEKSEAKNKMGLTYADWLKVIVGVIIGGLLFSREFRTKALSIVFNRNKTQPVTTANGVKYYARVGGWHYHIRSCEMLAGKQFVDLGYIEVNADYILNHHLKPDACIEGRGRRMR
jgi:hypothetical protein